MINEDFKRGVLAAAAIADDYNGCSTFKYRLGDCVAMKLNVVRRERPRLNRKRVDTVREHEVGMIRGIALALAELHRAGCSSTAVCGVARAAGITLRDVKNAVVDPYDWRELKKAGLR